MTDESTRVIISCPVKWKGEESFACPILSVESSGRTAICHAFDLSLY